MKTNSNIQFSISKFNKNYLNDFCEKLKNRNIE